MLHHYISKIWNSLNSLLEISLPICFQTSCGTFYWLHLMRVLVNLFVIIHLTWFTIFNVHLDVLSHHTEIVSLVQSGKCIIST